MYSTPAHPGLGQDLSHAAQAVYTALREAEYRSTAFIPYWNVPLLRAIVPRQRRCTEALKVINSTLDGLIAKSPEPGAWPAWLAACLAWP